MRDLADGGVWLDDLGYVIYRLANDSRCNVNFKVYLASNKWCDEFQFCSCSGQDLGQERPDDKELFLSGFVKWDGCSNWDIGQKHFCGVQEAEGIGKLLRQLYEIAGQTLPEYDSEIMAGGEGE